MKKRVWFGLALLLVLAGLWAGAHRVDRTAPVFDTEHGKQIILVSDPNRKGVVVPEENLPEILAWLDTHRIGERAGDNAVYPGCNSVRLRIAYTDGRVVLQGPDAISIQGAVYDLEAEPPPACYYDLVRQLPL